MSVTVQGVVKNGVVLPKTPLPEGAEVEIRLTGPDDVPPELQEELAAWQRASANSLALIEKLAQEREGNEDR